MRGGSRSKSEVLENVNLRAVASFMAKTKAENHTIWKLGQQLDTHVEEVSRLLQLFSNAASPQNIREFLERNHLTHATQLFGGPEIDEDGFQKAHFGRRDPIRDWLSGRTTSTASAANVNVQRPLTSLHQVSLSAMTRPERELLYNSWIYDSRLALKNSIMRVLEEYIVVKESYDSARQEIDLRCLKAAEVVGVTTSGLARITNLLGRLGSKVVVCEEAGEVLEAHALTTLLPSIEHAILIGDYLQLRPQIQNYNLQSDNPRGK